MTSVIALSALPTPVATYFAYAAGDEAGQAAELFLADSTVTDDGHTHRGHDAIRNWLNRSTNEYTFTTTAVRAEQDGTATVVTNHLEGNFPGCEVDLRYRFELDQQETRIQDLVIAP